MYPFRCSTSTSPDDELSERAAELYSLQADMPIKGLFLRDGQKFRTEIICMTSSSKK
jgi:hypothetical protein